jgi:glycosyltransferase involved in cell wall biosynthesis
MSGERVREGAGRDVGLFSIVAPVLDEELTIEQFCERVVMAVEGLPFELILVDDGSTDRTPELLERLAADDPRIRVIFLSRNFGHQAALTAGLDHARGDAIAMLDSDLQDPPELLPKLLSCWQEGSDVVYAVRRTREGESRLKLATAGWFYRLFSKLARIDLEPNAGDFSLLDRKALDSLGQMRERNRFLRGMTVWIGYPQTAIHYDRDARHAGETKYTPRKMVRFALDAIFSFSHVPLQVATMLGFLFSIVAFMGIPVAIGFKIAGEFVPGVTTLLLVVLLLGGIQLITVGIIGEYIGRVYEEVKGRPLYLVSKEVGGAPAFPQTSDRAEEARRLT